MKLVNFSVILIRHHNNTWSHFWNIFLYEVISHACGVYIWGCFSFGFVLNKSTLSSFCSYFNTSTFFLFFSKWNIWLFYLKSRIWLLILKHLWTPIIFLLLTIFRYFITGWFKRIIVVSHVKLNWNLTLSSLFWIFNCQICLSFSNS